ncbi:hypothetical protein ZIOFF_058757 [Zingiber officinale]|uniref:BI1-like protein n=1 Tax=Zingiber officinale TaxID=94328 RepID=A0A8J5F6Q3_ZINOF|nr:hypothetical protein ZIOFF_058757 [Zingiber officinale]
MKNEKPWDVEIGASAGLYPNMMESSELRWGFIRKVYLIVAMQILITIIIAAVMNIVPSIHVFFVSRTSNSIILAFVIMILPLLGNVVLEAAALTAIVFMGLTLYTFWAAKRGHDFSFLGPFLFAALLCLTIFSLIQIFFPLGKTTTMVFGCISAIIFSGFIVYDTDNLIKRHSYDEYVPAAISLYLDIINLFLALLSIMEE